MSFACSKSKTAQASLFPSFFNGGFERTNSRKCNKCLLRHVCFCQNKKEGEQWYKLSTSTAQGSTPFASQRRFQDRDVINVSSFRANRCHEILSRQGQPPPSLLPPDTAVGAKGSYIGFGPPGLPPCLFAFGNGFCCGGKK